MSSFSGSGGGGGADGNTVGAAEAQVIMASGYFSNSNITLSGSQSPSGGTAANGEVVLVLGQTNQVENGLWVVNTGGAWARLSYYTSEMVAKTWIHVVSPQSTVKFRSFYYNGTLAASAITIGISVITYTPFISETSAAATTTYNLKGDAAAGDVNLNFFANGGGNLAAARLQITASSGANGNASITNNGLGGLTLSGGAGLTLNGGASSNVNIATNMTSGDCNIGQSGSANDTFPRIYLNGPTRATAGISTPANRITTGSASSPTTRQLQMFFDPAGAAIASYTVTLPASTALVDGQELLVHAGLYGVTALTLTAGAGTSIRAAITTLATDGFARYKYIAAITTWVRIG